MKGTLMKKYYLLLIVACIAVATFAQQPIAKVALLDGNKLPVQTFRKTGNENVSKQSASSLQAPRKANTVAPNVISEIPASAEVKVYKRSGYFYQSPDFQETQQSGYTTIAFDGDDVYMFNPIADFKGGTWMKGKKEGNIIRFPLGQYLSWVDDEWSTYGLYTSLVFWDGSTATIDPIYQMISYTISGDQIIQNITAFKHTLGLVRSDTNTAYSHHATGGEYNTVFTHFDLSDLEIPAHVDVERWCLSSNMYYSSVIREVGVGIDGNDFYLGGLFSDYPNVAVKGTIGTDGTVTFESWQLLGESGGVIVYFAGYDNEAWELLDNVVMNYDSATGKLTSPKGQEILLCVTSYGSCIEYYKDDLTVTKINDTPIEVPANFVANSYSFEAHDVLQGKDVDDYEVQVGFVGDQVYIKGFCKGFLPDSWVVGTYDASKGTVVIPITYLGDYEYHGRIDNAFFMGARFDYDSTEDTFTSTGGYIVYDQNEVPFHQFESIVLKKRNEVAATPATPLITKFYLYFTPDEGSTYLRPYVRPYMDYVIPTTDTEGRELVRGKLSYKIMVEDADGNVGPLTLTTDNYPDLNDHLTEIPYGFTDRYNIYPTKLYLCQDFSTITSWKRIGIQSIYRGAGEEHVSEINWFDIQAYIAEMTSMLTPIISTAIGTIDADSQVRYYDLQGRIVDANSKGVFVKQITQRDGTVKNMKVVRK